MIGANLLYAKPMGSFGDAYQPGYGAEAVAGLGWGKTWIVATVGHNEFKADEGNPAGKLVYNPYKLGLRRYLLLNRLFINADAGIGYLKNKGLDNKEKRFIGGAGIGARLLGFEAGIYYDNIKVEDKTDFDSNIQFKLGWGIKL